MFTKVATGMYQQHHPPQPEWPVTVFVRWQGPETGDVYFVAEGIEASFKLSSDEFMELYRPQTLCLNPPLLVSVGRRPGRFSEEVSVLFSDYEFATTASDLRSIADFVLDILEAVGFQDVSCHEWE